MNIGDKVRSFSGNEEGFITRFLEKNQVEVEIEDGFQIPFMTHELVVISSTEAEIFGDRTASENLGRTEETFKKPSAEKGIFLAFKNRTERFLDVILINNTDLEILYLFGEEQDGNFDAQQSGTLTKRNYRKIHEMNLDKFERWPALIFQMLHYKSGRQTLKEPLVKKMRFKASNFHKSKKEAPLMGEEAYTFQIDAQLKTIDPQKLKEQLAGGNTVNPAEIAEAMFAGKPSKPSGEIDLHAEIILGNSFKQTPKNEILQKQLEAFESNLDRAILSGMDEVTFIHGVGNGVLKTEIQKRLSKSAHVKFFQDAQKGKFGYGATLVVIK
jgi:hypothetical protein